MPVLCSVKVARNLVVAELLELKNKQKVRIVCRAGRKAKELKNKVST